MENMVVGVYISKLEKFGIVNGLIILIIFIVESLPIIYQSILIPFIYTEEEQPEYIVRYLKYCSYYKVITSKFISNTNFQNYLVLITFLIIFIVFYGKHFYLSRDIKILDHILTNLFEFGFCRIFTIFFFDIEIVAMSSNSMLSSIVSVALFFITIGILMFHLKKNIIYLRPKKMRNDLLVNKLLNTLDFYHLFQKILVCLIENFQFKQKHNQNIYLVYYFSLIFFLVNLLCFIHTTFLIFFDKYTFFYHKRAVIYMYIKSVFITFAQVILVVFRVSNRITFLMSLIKILFFSVVFFKFSEGISRYKLFKKGNELPLIVYFINLKGNFNVKKNILFNVLVDHLTITQKSSFNFCDFSQDLLEKKQKNNSNLEEKFVVFFYKSLIKKRFKQSQDLLKSNLTMFYLLKFAVLTYSTKSIFKINVKFQRIKKIFLFNKAQYFKSFHFISFMDNFDLNLKVLYKGVIKNQYYTNSENKKFLYLIKVDEIANCLRKMLDKLDTFLTLRLDTPQEVFNLSRTFSELKNSTDFGFLISTNMKLNYQCMLCDYILEEMLNRKSDKSVNLSENIHQYDEFLNVSYQEDTFILSVYDAEDNTLRIRQCSQEFNSLKGEKFTHLFPKYIRKEGRAKLNHYILKAHSQIFHFYVDYNECVEFVRFSFFSLPVFPDTNLIYLGCVYRLEKEKIIIVQRKRGTLREQRRILNMSEKMKAFCEVSAFDPERMMRHSKYFDKERKELRISCRGTIINAALKETIGNCIDVIHIYEEQDIKKKKSSTQYLISLIEVQGNTTVGSVSVKINNTATETSTSVMTKGSQSLISNKNKKERSKKIDKMKGFYLYSYYILFFNVLMLIVLSVFLSFELVNNEVLKNFFGIITNFNDYQNYVYHSSLSLFSISCVAESVSDTSCKNKFKDISEEFIKKFGLSPNQQIYEFLINELSIKSNLILQSLNTWIQNKNSIKSEEVQRVSSDDFDFYSVQEIEGRIITNRKTITFNEAMKRYVDLLSIVPMMDNFLNSPIYIISSDGKDYVDLTNILKDKDPQDSFYLNESQRYYYIILINFQKYIMQLLSVGIALFNEYKSKLNYTKVEIYLFILGLVLFHLVIIGVIISFIFKYKKIHINYYNLIYEKLCDNNFIIYFKKKIGTLGQLLKLYNKNPVFLIDSINKLKIEEEERVYKELKAKTTPGNDENDEKANRTTKTPEMNFDKKAVDKIHTQILCFEYIQKTFFWLLMYLILEVLFLTYIRERINRLLTTNVYSNYNYKISNYMFINLCLLQLMSFTNQTDSDFFNYFSSTLDKDDKNGFVNEKIKDLLHLIKDIEALEENSSQFKEVKKALGNISCDTIYMEFNDPIITGVNDYYSEIDYIEMLKKYCSTVPEISENRNEKFMYDSIIYSQDKLLRMFTDQSYETLSKINESDLLYNLYSSVLMVIRPIRRFVYTYMKDEIISKQISAYSLTIIIFIFINFLFDCGFLIYIKILVIDSIIDKIKEILLIADSFGC